MKKDPILKRVFSIPEMVELLIRRRHPELASELDFSTLQEQPTELVSKHLVRRVPDMLLLVDHRSRSRKVLIHLELQATVHPRMALRNHVYPGLAVVSMVLYHGKGRWTAPLDVEELVPGLNKREVVEPEAVEPDLAAAEHAPEIVLGLLVPGQSDIDLLLLAGVTDLERMERVAEAVIACADGREFLADARLLLESG